MSFCDLLLNMYTSHTADEDARAMVAPGLCAHRFQGCDSLNAPATRRLESESERVPHALLPRLAPLAEQQ